MLKKGTESSSWRRSDQLSAAAGTRLFSTSLLLKHRIRTGCCNDFPRLLFSSKSSETPNEAQSQALCKADRAIAERCSEIHLTLSTAGRRGEAERFPLPVSLVLAVTGV